MTEGCARYLPQEPGYYIWAIVDLDCMDIGLVHVMKDPASHLQYLRNKYGEYKERDDPLVYENLAGETLTMYFEGRKEAQPWRDKDGIPDVEGYRKVEFKDLLPLKEDRVPLARFHSIKIKGGLTHGCTQLHSSPRR